MSLKSKIEAVIYASEEPVTLQQLVGLLAEETESELRALDAMQTQLPLDEIAGENSRGDKENSDRSEMQNETAPDGMLDEPSSTASAEAESAELDGDNAEQTSAGEAAAINAGAESSTTGDAEDETSNASDPAADPRAARERDRQVRDHLRRTIDTLMRDYAESDRGIEIREVAGGFRMGTKPEYHDAVRGFVKSLKPALKLTLQALETLAVVAYKQPVTAAEISEIRGVDSAGVLGGLIGRKLIATAGRKQVIGRPMLYKTTKEFLVRFGLKDVHELPSMEEFERLAGELNEQDDLPMEQTEAIIERANARGDADHIRETTDPVSEVDPNAFEGINLDLETEGNAVPQPSTAPPAEPDADEHETTPTTNDESTVAEPGGTADEEDRRT